MAEIIDPALREAAGLDPILAPLANKDLLSAPVFETSFESLAFPAYNGMVRVRYATVGDTMEIEALAAGGGFFKEAVATIQVCVEKAPATWYKANGSGVPVLDLRAVPDAEAVGDLYVAYRRWRESFRRTGKPSDLGETVP